ncbi:dynein axonemal assembly factor 3-like [Amphiura filiformis]|uniref:dynein axonemal assembly factor 3-like n=1 Tax=Amphiura filiformis TaxID=82378 RepID=UPI003B219C31
MVDAFGAVTWWGFTPAIDLQEEDLCGAASNLSINEKQDEGALHALIIGAGDSRHIIKTIARAGRHKERKLNFYIIENNHEVLARHLLFLSLCLESPDRMGLQEKTELFLELFGNTLIRQQTNDYVITKANQFIKMVTDFDHMAERMPIMDMSALKFKERDHLEAIFKFWRNPDNRIFDVSKCWDNRLRKHLQVRYDSRRGAYDWDYNMKLLERGAGIINHHHYAKWRESGVAFEVREGTYDVPNRTLASGLFVKAGGERVAQRGYWGDIVSSPYLAFGIECEEDSLLKKANGVHVKTAEGISEYNILSMLHELTTKEKYILPQPKADEKGTNKPEPAKLEEITEEEEEDEEETKSDEQTQDSGVQGSHDNKEDTEPIPLDNVKVYFLPLGCVTDLHKKAKYRDQFNLVYFSNSMVHHLTQDTSAIFADRTTVITETAQFMLELNPEQCEQFVSKVTGMATNAGCKESDQSKVDVTKQSFLKFKFERKT